MHCPRKVVKCTANANTNRRIHQWQESVEKLLLLASTIRSEYDFWSTSRKTFRSLLSGMSRVRSHDLKSWKPVPCLPGSLACNAWSCTDKCDTMLMECCYGKVRHDKICTSHANRLGMTPFAERIDDAHTIRNDC